MANSGFVSMIGESRSLSSTTTSPPSAFKRCSPLTLVDSSKTVGNAGVAAEPLDGIGERRLRNRSIMTRYILQFVGISPSPRLQVVVRSRTWLWQCYNGLFSLIAYFTGKKSWQKMPLFRSSAYLRKAKSSLRRRRTFLSLSFTLQPATKERRQGRKFSFLPGCYTLEDSGGSE